MFDNYYFEALILKRRSLRKVELLQLIDELMQRKSNTYNELEKAKKQLSMALNGLFEICNNPDPDFNRILYAREVWHKVKELK